jgi:hypothetical protein
MKLNKSSIIAFCLSCFFLLLFLSPSLSAEPLDDWLPSDSGTLNILYGVTYGVNTFISAGNYGTILVSSDGGTTWTLSSNTDTHHLYGIGYGNNGSELYVSVGTVGTILTSPDGLNWTKRTSGTSNYLAGVTYGNGIFVAVGGSGKILTSSDGVVWTSRTSGTANWLAGVTYGEGIFVAVGAYGTILTSPNGVNWTVRVSGTAHPLSFDLSGIVYGDGTFVAVGDNGTVRTSPDGITWTTQTTGLLENLFGVTYGEGTFVAVGNGGIILSSPDGVIWTLRPSGTPNSLSGISYGCGTFIAVGEQGTILLSVVSDPAPLTIVTSYLPSGSVGIEYSQTLTAGCGVFPYTWSIASGNFPPGLSLDSNTGEIFGTPSSAGTYTFAIEVTDADSSTATRQFSISIVLPDLTVSSLTVPASGGAGSTINVTDTTRNGGGGSAAASTTSFYLSTNTTWDVTDVLLGSRAVPALNPVTTSTGTTAVVIPAGTAPRTYYVIAKADDGGAVAETNETNNTAYRTIVVGP